MTTWQDFIKNKKQCDIVVIGDSIGDGSVSTWTYYKWTSLLRTEIENTTGVTTTLTNFAVGGTAAMFDYHRVKRFGKNINCDIALVCDGENDAESTFGFNYEVLLRNIRLTWPNCVIISTMESSQRDYTPKMQQIQRLAPKYGCILCDTIKKFNESGRPYEELLADTVHPNDAGQRLYFEEAFESLTKRFVPTFEMPLPEVSEEMRKYDKYRYVPAFEMQRNLRDYRVKANAVGFLFNCLEGPRAFEYDVYIDGETVRHDSFQRNQAWTWERTYYFDAKEEECELAVLLSREDDVALFLGVGIIGEE